MASLCLAPQIQAASETLRPVYQRWLVWKWSTPSHATGDHFGFGIIFRFSM